MSKHNLPARGNRRLPMQRGDHGASGGAMCFDHPRQVRLAICVQCIERFIQQPELAVLYFQPRQSCAAFLARRQHSAGNVCWPRHSHVR